MGVASELLEFSGRCFVQVGQIILYVVFVIPPAIIGGFACASLLFTLKLVAAVRDGTCDGSVWFAFSADSETPLAQCTHVQGANRWLFYFLCFSGVFVAWLYSFMGNSNATGGFNTVLKSIQTLEKEITRLDDEHKEVLQTEEEAARRAAQMETFKGAVALRMCPLVWIGTVITHLFGGSAGREGSALQMTAGIFSKYTDFAEYIISKVRPEWKLSLRVRRSCLVASIATGFSGIFGVPLAGAIFSVEVLRVGELQMADTLVPGIIGAYTADWACRASNKWIFGFEGHSEYPCESCHTTPQNWVPFMSLPTLMAVVLAGIAFGVCAYAFEFLKSNFAQLFGIVADKLFPKSWKAYTVPYLGGIVIVAFWLVLCAAAATPSLNTAAVYDGTNPASYTFAEPYLGLGVDTPGISILSCFQTGTVLGPGVQWYSFLLKLIFTTLTLGAGYKGGEVTPLMFIGATLGHVVGAALGEDTQLFSALGFVAVFAGCTNTPLACCCMGVELFGGSHVFHFFVACFVSYLISNADKVGGVYKEQADPRNARIRPSEKPQYMKSLFAPVITQAAPSEKPQNMKSLFGPARSVIPQVGNEAHSLEAGGDISLLVVG